MNSSDCCGRKGQSIDNHEEISPPCGLACSALSPIEAAVIGSLRMAIGWLDQQVLLLCLSYEHQSQHEGRRSSPQAGWQGRFLSRSDLVQGQLSARGRSAERKAGATFASHFPAIIRLQDDEFCMSNSDLEQIHTTVRPAGCPNLLQSLGGQPAHHPPF